MNTPNTAQNGGNNKIQHQSIALPKGGGSIRGIGEKFQANAVTGTGSFTAPLPISPGRGGFAPQLTLGYDSGAGNGEFGLGWDVGVPLISRKTDKQLPRYRDDEESDIFLLSGAEDLVPVLELQGDQWQRVSQPVTETENGVTTHYTVYPYRPRIEGLFARIERWVNDETGETHWQATTRENITSVYGRSADARVSDPADERKVFQWLLETSHDAKGNGIVYEYKAENRQNIPWSTNEKHRLTGPQPFVNRHLKRVLYSPLADDPGRFHCQLVFDYGEHTQNTPDEDLPWPVRQDPISSYKAGFEVRTYRLCQRVLMFHNFPTGAADEWQLVKATELTYEQSPVMSYLTIATQRGYQKNASGYDSKALPPLEFRYTRLEIQGHLQQVDRHSLENLPVGLDNGTYQWVDLEGEGLSGILSHQGNALYYKANVGNGAFGPARVVSAMPQPLTLEGPLQITDINGDGNNELLLRSRDISGFFEYRQGRWQNFVPFQKNLSINWNDPNLKLIDLNGDGFLDVLITEQYLFRWYPSRAHAGFDEARVIAVPADDNKGPSLVFADQTQSIYLADMTGDSLTDIVRIRNGEVCYWPNLGHGRFGAKVNMHNPPLFDSPERFNQQYVKLGDIDGSGTTDIFYFGNGRTRYWLNQAGNGFSGVQTLDIFPPVDSLSSVALVDFTGKGTLTLVWSTHRPGPQALQLSYVDLMVEKPHLLCEIDNHLGKIIRLQYAPSTQFYLADKLAGKPWITKLPFPVQVLAQVETIDQISGSRLVSRYVYHHGYFDGVEREFRGFGLVETIDTETFENYSGDPKHYVAPVLTRTWFHNGAYIEDETVSQHYVTEYYQGDPQAFLLPDTVIEHEETMSLEERREAHRALKGSTLRQEIYELGQDVPYQVTESNLQVKRLQPEAAGNHHGVFFVHANETITFHYEQNPADPRIVHDFTLEVDDFGQVKQSGQLVYPRWPGPEVKSEQLKPYATLTVNDYIHVTEPFYLLGVAYDTRTYELGGPLPVTADRPLPLEQVRTLAQAALANAIPCDQDFSGGVLQARLFNWNCQYFWDAAQAGSLPAGQITAQALLHHSEVAVLTPGLISQAYGTDVTDPQLRDAGYVWRDGHWWNPGLVQHYSPGGFYLPVKTTDPLGGWVIVSYDDYRFMPVRTEDALGNTSFARIDYRTLQPWQLTDPNGNVSEAISDPLGMVIATSVYGSENGQPRGDRPLFQENGAPYYQIIANPTVADILAQPARYLQEATTFFYYDLEAWDTRQEPPQALQLARETHVHDLAAGETIRIQQTIAYSDGFGRALQSKLRVELGKAWVKRADHRFEEQEVGERWLVSGRTVYNNKEKPIKQYEPFYSASDHYEPEAFFANYGVTPIIHYDPLLRVVRTDTPKGFFSKVEFTPWEIRTYDENDTVKDSDYYRQFNALAGLLATDPAAEREALQKAATHYNTPQVSLLDTLGREFANIAYKLDVSQLTEANRAEHELVTYTVFSITGKPLAITDPRQYAQPGGVPTLRYGYDMTDQVIRTLSIDAGDDRVFNNVLGKPVISLDARGHRITVSYDCLQRPMQVQVAGNGLNHTVERIVYGESITEAQAHNLRGQVYQHYDQAGRVTVPLYSFKGQPLTTERQIRSDYKAEADWREGSNWNALLENETFTTGARFDALGRLVEQHDPDGSIAWPEYHQSGKLNRIKVQLKGETTSTVFVTGITYNPKGQRETIRYGNGTETVYGYERETFRLTSLVTRRLVDNEVLQNIAYTFDPVGNITRLVDHSHDRVFHSNQVVDPVQSYTYDALYRLTEATGREHLGLAGNPSAYKAPNAFKQSQFAPLNDGQQLANYREEYFYDHAGNLYRIRHFANRSELSFTRDIEVDSRSNRAILREDTTPATVNFDEYFDHNGNMIRLEHLTEISWNYRDNIASATIIKRTGSASDAEYYVYDAQGNRVRKVKETLKSGNQVEIEEKLYLGAVEIKRIRMGSSLTLERSSLHVMDDKSRIAIVHHWTRDSQQREIIGSAELNQNKLRYQYGNHLGSASLELDKAGKLISYEEYYPYGGTSFMAGENQAEVKLKEYRYTGKERDDTTGLYYYGARYYAPWLGKWVSCDPKKEGLGSVSLYVFCRNNPIVKIDPDGSITFDANNPSVFINNPNAQNTRIKSSSNVKEFDEEIRDAYWFALGVFFVGMYYNDVSNAKDLKDATNKFARCVLSDILAELIKVPAELSVESKAPLGYNFGKSKKGEIFLRRNPGIAEKYPNSKLKYTEYQKLEEESRKLRDPSNIKEDIIPLLKRGELIEKESLTPLLKRLETAGFAGEEYLFDLLFSHDDANKSDLDKADKKLVEFITSISSMSEEDLTKYVQKVEQDFLKGFKTYAEKKGYIVDVNWDKSYNEIRSLDIRMAPNDQVKEEVVKFRSELLKENKFEYSLVNIKR